MDIDLDNWAKDMKPPFRDFGKLFLCDHPSQGDDWMRGRLRPDDIAMCIRFDGGSFYRYVLINNNAFLGAHGPRGYRVIPGSVFAAYGVGSLYEFQPTTLEAFAILSDPAKSVPIAADTRRE